MREGGTEGRKEGERGGKGGGVNAVSVYMHIFK